ncbi:Man1-Src1p-C-terminal domain-containing protein [Umbelopsis sp. AD052]|nr:Man1-Src1p-C-terminal domain-containing protein [Umbelopsis sp. AD052]
MTDVPPDLYYLNEGFDPSHLKIAELRGILLKHDVPYTPTAKKPELVQSFKKNVATKADELLSLHRQLKPNGKGIVNISTDKKAKGSTSKASSKSVPVDEGERDDEEDGKDSDGEESVNAKVRREKRAAKSVDAEGFAIPAQPSKTKPTSTRKKPKTTEWTVGSGLTSESEVDAKPTTAKSSSIRRKKEKPTKDSAVDASGDKKHVEPSFSDANPFQSGAESDVSVTRKSRKAPIVVEKQPTESKKQHIEPEKAITAEVVKPSADKAEGSSRRSRREPQASSQYFNPQDSFASSGGEEEHPVERKQPKTAIKTKPKTSTSSKAETPEKPKVVVATSSSSRPEYAVVVNKTTKHSLQQIVTSTISILLGLYCIYWCLERHRVGYCDLSQDHSGNDTQVDLLDLEVNGTTIWDAVRPSCIPCPKHGHCTKGRLLGCDDFFVRIPSMLSFGGWIPVGEKCVPDTVKQRRAFRVENQIKHMLAVKKGQYICGDIKAEKGETEEEVASMKVEDVWTELLVRKPDTISEQQLEEYWRLAMASLMTYSEREVSFLDRGDDKYMISRQPKLSLGCRVRLQIKDVLYRWRFELGGLLAVVGLIGYGNYLYLQRRKDMKLVAELAGEAFVKLQDQERNHHIDPVLFPQACCAITHLRDLILAQEPSVERRRHLWNHVRKIVESNSNVRTLSAEVRGEPHRCWEWVGYGQTAERIPVGSGIEIHSGEMMNTY